MSRKVNHLKDELRRTFTIYALIPTFLMASFILVLTFVYWNNNILSRNQQKLDNVSGNLEKMVSGYMAYTEEIAAYASIPELRGSIAARTEMYEKLYGYSNNMGMHARFYLFDNAMNLLVANQNQEPEFAALAKKAKWGIVGQIRQNPTLPMFSFVSAIKNYTARMDLVIGRAILDQGQIAGYVFFVVPSEQLSAMIANPYVYIVVKDKFDYTPICTDDFFCTAMNKMKPEFIRTGGYFPYAERKYYISQKDILNGELTIYALTSIGGIVSQLTNAVILLFGVLIILSVAIVITVKKQVEEKTKMIDQIVEAFAALKEGNLDMRLNINTNNEFEIISEAYNLMLSSLKELMETNREKARATVISEIKQLESQFNPHFLFNTLENIKFMVKLDPAAAGKMIVALSRLLRYSIDQGCSEVTIKEDMEYIHNYLDIQKYRFGQRLNYIFELADELNACIVPKLIFQPIIENAVKYGLQDGQHMLVEIQGAIVNNELVIHIKNNGAQMDEDTLYEIRRMLKSCANFSHHSGLYNVNRRIQLMYGAAYGLQIMSSAGTDVKIVLPINKKLAKKGYQNAQSIDCRR